MPRRMNPADLQKQLNALPLSKLLTMVKAYAEEHNVDLASARNMLVAEDLQYRLKEHGINSCCPSCGSAVIVGYGKNGSVQRFKCRDCGRTFSLFTDTILEKTRYHWDVWVKVVEMVLNHIPVEHMRETLIKDYGLDGLDYKTVFHWKHKVIHALASMPMPKLSGIVQVDETFFREGQKGSRHLQSTVNGENRQARYGRRPSKYGVMGNEFANVVAAVDHSGHCVAQVAGLGRLTVEMFTDLFGDYIDNPSYLCSDGNTVYKSYCDVKDIPLYAKPSNYLFVTQREGYLTPDWSNPVTAKATEANNMKVLASLYSRGLIDCIYGHEHMPYKDFLGVKSANGLSLARVNQFHSELKRHIERNTCGVSTKYLADYVGFQVFLRNWSVDHGEYPSSRTDAESILIAILKGGVNFTASALKKAALTLRETSGRYMALLKEKTAEMRKLTGNRYFKYDEEDKVGSFNKKDFLYDLPAYKLDKLCSKYRIPHKWAKYSKVSQLLKKAGIGEDILQLIDSDRHYKISPEDEAAIRDRAFCTV